MLMTEFGTAMLVTDPMSVPVGRKVRHGITGAQNRDEAAQQGALARVKVACQ